jgi:hypothetical protein
MTGNCIFLLAIHLTSASDLWNTRLCSATSTPVTSPVPAEQFEAWDHASGQVVAGLLRRRLAEEKLFIEGEVAA